MRDFPTVSSPRRDGWTFDLPSCTARHGWRVLFGENPDRNTGPPHLPSLACRGITPCQFRFASSSGRYRSRRLQLFLVRHSFSDDGSVSASTLPPPHLPSPACRGITRLRELRRGRLPCQFRFASSSGRYRSRLRFAPARQARRLQLFLVRHRFSDDGSISVSCPLVLPRRSLGVGGSLGEGGSAFQRLLPVP